MQKSSPALVVHYAATDLFVGLSNDSVLCDFRTVPSRDVSKLLIPTIADLLAAHGITLETLVYIACYIGPGPFTTLRSIVVTVNGLGFARNIPLIQMNGALLLLEEAHRPGQATYALFNAYCHEMYCATYKNAEPLVRIMSWEMLEQTVRDEQKKAPSTEIVFVGAGVSLYRGQIEGMGFTLPDSIIEHASLAFVTKKAHELWGAGMAAARPLSIYYGRTASGAVTP